MTSIKISKRALGYKIGDTGVFLDEIIGTAKIARQIYNESKAIQWLVENTKDKREGINTTNQLPSMETHSFRQRCFYNSVRNILMNLAFFDKICTLEEAIKVTNELVTKNQDIHYFAEYACSNKKIKDMFREAISLRIYK